MLASPPFTFFVGAVDVQVEKSWAPKEKHWTLLVGITTVGVENVQSYIFNAK